MKKNHCSQAVRRYLMTEGELTGEAVDDMTPNEMFEEILNLEGILYNAENIKRIVKDCYGIDLNHYEEYLDMDSMAEED